MLAPLLKKSVPLMVAALFFIAMFVLAQAEPGPIMMIVTLVGWHVAGWLRLLVTTLTKFGPSSLLVGVVLHLCRCFKDRSWRTTLQAGLVPMTVGLVVVSAALITRSG